LNPRAVNQHVLEQTGINTGYHRHCFRGRTEERADRELRYDFEVLLFPMVIGNSLTLLCIELL
jgi:hypothetical protein